jgi:hypothetical protein
MPFVPYNDYELEKVEVLYNEIGADNFNEVCIKKLGWSKTKYKSFLSWFAKNYDVVEKQPRIVRFERKKKE